jgi:hypothetical protein
MKMEGRRRLELRYTKAYKYIIKLFTRSHLTHLVSDIYNHGLEVFSCDSEQEIV